MKVTDSNDVLLDQIAKLRKNDIIDLQNAMAFEKMAKEKAQADYRECMLNLQEVRQKVQKFELRELVVTEELTKTKEALKKEQFENQRLREVSV